MVVAQSERLKSWLSATAWGSAPWQRVLLAFIAALLFYAVPSADASVGLDPSWESALALAQAHNLSWGPDIVFTAGPLGYLHNPVDYYFGQSLAACAYQLAVLTVLFLGIAAALRHRCNPITSLIGAFLTTGVANFMIASLYPDLAVLAAFAWASVLLLQQDAKPSATSMTCVALGAAAGLQLLVKVNSGLTILLIALSVSLLMSWKSIVRHGVIICSFTASTVASWLIAGQPLVNLPFWWRMSGEILSGYSDAMAVPLPAVAIPSILLVLAWMIAVCVMFVRGAPDIPRRYSLLTGLVSVIIAKTAFGRFDAGHISIMLSFIVVAIAVTPLATSRQRTLVLAAVILLFLGLAGPFVYDRAKATAFSPVRATQRLLTITMPDAWNARVDQSKARQRARYAIPTKFIDSIGSATVHVDPSETSAAWSYNLAWHPVPAFQTYFAYTPSLDLLNSNSLARGPEYVLSHLAPDTPATGVDGRLSTQESPRYSRTLLCHYHLRGIENNWALFAFGPPRCGPLTPVAEVRVGNNETVPIPRASGPDKAMLVSIELEQNLFDFLFQGRVAPLTSFTVTLDGVSYRLVAENATEPFLVDVPVSAERTNLAIHAHSIRVARHTSFGTYGVPARLRFSEMQVGGNS